MSTRKATLAHEGRLLRVIDHVHSHVGDELSLDSISDVAAMSRYHWHRTYKGLTGKTVGETIRRIKLNSAARELAQTDHPIDLAAGNCGYPTRRSFDRAFYQIYRCTAAAFRKHASAIPGLGPFEDSPAVIDISVVQRPAITVAALEHRGLYEESAATMHRLVALCTTRKVEVVGSSMGIFIEAGTDIPLHLRRALVALAIDPSTELSDPLVPHVVPAGRYAAGVFIGPSAALPRAWEVFCAECERRFGDQFGDGLCFEVYCDDPDTSQTPGTLRTEMYLSLR